MLSQNLSELWKLNVSNILVDERHAKVRPAAASEQLVSLDSLKP